MNFACISKKKKKNFALILKRPFEISRMKISHAYFGSFHKFLALPRPAARHGHWPNKDFEKQKNKEYKPRNINGPQYAHVIWMFRQKVAHAQQ